MQEIKQCIRCGKVISDSSSSDWHRHLSVKYCANCKKIVDREKSAARMRRKRANDFLNTRIALEHEKNELLQEQVRLVREENEALRQMLAETRERMEEK